MSLQEIYDQSIWDGFITQQSWTSFQQSWAWGEFQKTQGHQVKRFFFMIDGQPVLAAQMIHYKRRFSGYWFCPRGPVFTQHPSTGSGSRAQSRDASRIAHHQFLKEIANALKPQPLFFRFEPQIEIKPAEGLMPLGMRRNHAMSPASTIVVDLKRTEDELQAAMHQKTRYNIRVAQKHEVIIQEGEDFDAFAKLLTETAERRDWTPHARSYLKATYDFFAPRGIARLRFAKYKGQVIAANMEIAFGDTVTYLHGGSSSTSREVKAPQLLQWEAMRTAKQQGYHFYDLWGCNPEARSSYYYKFSWEGITRFKRDFGGRQVDLVGTWDLPMNKLFYHFVFWQEFIRR